MPDKIRRFGKAPFDLGGNPQALLEQFRAQIIFRLAQAINIFGEWIKGTGFGS